MSADPSYTELTTEALNQALSDARAELERCTNQIAARAIRKRIALLIDEHGRRQFLGDIPW